MAVFKQFSNQTLIAGGRSRNRGLGGWTCIERGFSNCDSCLQNIHSFTFSKSSLKRFLKHFNFKLSALFNFGFDWLSEI